MPRSWNTGDERKQQTANWRQQSSPRHSVDYSPTAEGIRRIAEVADELEISPETARIAFEEENGDIPTDVSLSDAIEIVESRTNGEDRQPRR